jgi:acyl transferase domain-containing protein
LAEGLLADWRGFQPSGAGRESPADLSLCRKRHWIAADSSPVRRASQPAASVHPMVDTNESTFERQLFKKTFHDRDFFIYDHRVSDIPTLPGVAYLELARKAGEIAAGRPVRRIQNILWVSPISVERSSPKEVFIELKPHGETVQFEVFSETAEGKKTLHSQGKLLYTNRPESAADPDRIDLEALRSRCVKSIDGKSAYPIFQSVDCISVPAFGTPGSLAERQ